MFFSIPISSELYVSHTLYSSSAATLVHAFICLRLDYGGSLYSGLPAVKLIWLQSEPLLLVRLCVRSGRHDFRSDHMTTVLHWLPYPAHCRFRILRMVTMSEWRKLHLTSLSYSTHSALSSVDPICAPPLRAYFSIEALLQSYAGLQPIIPWHSSSNAWKLISHSK